MKTFAPTGISKRIAVAVFLLVALMGSQFVPLHPTSADTPAVLDAYGGYTGLKGTATGFFHTQKLNNQWWLIDPAGNSFYSVGVSVVNSGGMPAADSTNPYLDTLKAKYGNPVNDPAWANDTAERLKGWGYNTVGPYSSPSMFTKMPYVINLSVLDASINYTRSQNGGLDQAPILYEQSAYDSIYRRHFFDVFDPTFATQTDSYISSAISQGGYQQDPYLIGYVADNEVPLWYGRCVTCTVDSPWTPGKTMADVYIAMPSTTAGKQAWVSYLQNKYISIAALNAAWGGGAVYGSFSDLQSVNVVATTSANSADKSAFLGQIMSRYFGTIRAAIRKYDANHMYLGGRLITCCGMSYAPEVYQQLAANADVASINYYLFYARIASDTAAMRTDLDNMYNAFYTGLGGQIPIMNMEFSFSGADFRSNPINHPNGAILATQEERTRAYADYQRLSARLPGVVGTLWWSYFDPPPQGAMRGGEDANLGLVDNSDNPYGSVMYRMANENRNVYTYRGLTAPQGRILSGSGAQVAALQSAIQSTQPAEVTPRSLTVSETTYLPRLARDLAPGSLTPNHITFLPFLTKGFYLQPFSISYSTSVPITQTTVIVYDGSGPHATQKRKIVSNGSVPAGNNTIIWDGLDDNGQPVPKGWYYYMLGVNANDNSTDYSIGRIGMGQTVPDWQAYFFRYDAYQSMIASARYVLAVSVFNTGSQTWSSSETSLSYRWINANGQVTQQGQVVLPKDVAPSSSVVLTTTVTVPSIAGAYTLKWDMQKAGAYFEALGGQPLQYSVTVQ